jgi:DNA-binding transcriptional LysR family regulator
MSTGAPGIVEREMAARGERRRLRFTSPHFFGVLRAVAASDLIACLSERLVRAFARQMKLSFREVPLEMPDFTDAARRVRE